MKNGEELQKLRRLRDARTTHVELFLDALVAIQISPQRLHRCRDSVRLRTVEAYRRLRPGRLP